MRPGVFPAARAYIDRHIYAAASCIARLRTRGATAVLLIKVSPTKTNFHVYGPGSFVLRVVQRGPDRKWARVLGAPPVREECSLCGLLWDTLEVWARQHVRRISSYNFKFGSKEEMLRLLVVLLRAYTYCL